MGGGERDRGNGSNSPRTVRNYILDGGNADLRRLLSISQRTAEAARAAFRRIGMQDGWNVIDCGCGPVGALPVLAEMVGPTGRVVGVDFSAPTVERARTVAAELQLDNVEVMAGDIHQVDATTLGGPFDLAFTRLFLMHQADLAYVLSQIAGLLRPGGWLITHEPLLNPPPRSHPQLASLEAYWALVYKVMESSGARPRAIDDLPRTARTAGFEVVQADGFFLTDGPELGFELHAEVLDAARERAIGFCSRFQPKRQSGHDAREANSASSGLRAFTGCRAATWSPGQRRSGTATFRSSLPGRRSQLTPVPRPGNLSAGRS